MSKILLTSNGFFTDQIKDEFEQLIERKEKNNIKVAIIITASLQKQNNRFALKARNDLLEMGFKHIDFFDVEFEEAENLKQFDVIYISGGNPFYLLHHMKKSNADIVLKDLVKNGVIIVGVSAGAVILGPNINVVNYFTPQLNTVKLRNLTALGITENMIFPHYDREDLFQDDSGKTIEERLRVFENQNNCSVVRLRDDQYLLL